MSRDWRIIMAQSKNEVRIGLVGRLSAEVPDTDRNWNKGDELYYALRSCSIDSSDDMAADSILKIIG